MGVDGGKSETRRRKGAKAQRGERCEWVVRGEIPDGLRRAVFIVVIACGV